MLKTFTPHQKLQKMDGDQRLMVFSNGVGGHHPIYLQHLVEYWIQKKLAGQLFLVVSPQLLKQHSNLFDLPLAKENKIQFIPISESEHDDIVSQKSSLSKAFKEWQIICKYVKDLNIEHCLITCIDHFQPILVFKNPGCKVSGIYLRPTFHYADFEGHTTSWSEQIKQLRQKWVLSRVLVNSKLESLFCLDPFAVEYINRKQYNKKLLHLPDPIRRYARCNSKVKELRKELEISNNKRVFLFFGVLDSRKGIYQVFEAIQYLPEELRKNFCLVLVGKISALDKEKIEAYVEEVSRYSSIEIIIRDKYVSETEMLQYFEVTDVVLAPYQKHVGMSGILLLAAAMEKPVLSSSYGLMGELTRRYKLGLTVDSTKPYLISQSLIRFLIEPTSNFYSSSKMRQLIEQNAAEKFAETILSRLISN